MRITTADRFIIHAAGGGYKKRNVARCWTFETAVLIGQEDLVTDQIPYNMYIDNFRNEKVANNADKMNVDDVGSLLNVNKAPQLEQTRIMALEHLRHLEVAPGERALYLLRCS